MSKHTLQMAGVITRGRLMSDGTVSRTMCRSFPSNTISLMQILWRIILIRLISQYC
jgi:hypothetical protein